MGLIGFSIEHEKKLLNATSPFIFSIVGESSILRLLKLIECDNNKIGTYAKLVKDRNETSHPNGQLLFNSEANLEAKIREVLRVVEEIQTHSRATVERCYDAFLRGSHDADEREYADATDQIREELVHRHYFSPSDIALCRNYPLTSFGGDANFAAIEELHQSLLADYPES